CARGAITRGGFDVW
nr:immunoglobulin heavy chain junction region [Mus musculus]